MPNLTQDYARLINQAIVELPGASDAGIKQALFEVLHEFFEETNSWQEIISVPIVANTTVYPLVLVEGGEFVRLMSLLNTKNTPQPAITDLVGTMTLRDIPNSNDTWTAYVAKTIGIPVDKDGKPQVPDWTISRFEPIVIAGLLGRMMMQPRKPFSNPTTAKYHLQRFRNGLGKVKSAVIHGNLYGAQAWRFPRSFAAHSQRNGFGGIGNDQSFGGN